MTNILEIETSLPDSSGDINYQFEFKFTRVYESFNWGINNNDKIAFMLNINESNINENLVTNCYCRIVKYHRTNWNNIKWNLV